MLPIKLSDYRAVGLSDRIPSVSVPSAGILQVFLFTSTRYTVNVQFTGILLMFRLQVYC